MHFIIYIKRFLIVISLIMSILACKSTKDTAQSPVSKSEQTETHEQNKDNSTVFFDANKEKMLGNYDEAKKLYQKCLDINPEDDASMFELAKIYKDQKNFTEALNYAQQATETDPTNEYYLLFYADLLPLFERYKDAIDVVNKLIKLNPDKIEYYNKLALLYLYNDQPDEAIRIYDELEKKVGIREEFSITKQKIYLQENKVNKAIAEILKLIEHFPNVSQYYAILAELYLSNGMNEKALATYNKIVEIDPENPYIHISLADYYRKNGQEFKAFEELKMGFANPALDIDSKIQILLKYYTANEIYNNLKDQSFELAEILIKTHPNDPKAFSMYGDFLYQDKQFEEARSAFRKVIEIDSSKYLIWEQLLFTESELNDLDALLVESRKTIELFPEQPLPYLFLGSTYYQKKQWDLCVDILNQGLYYVVNNDPMKAQFYAYLGDAYNQLKDNEKSDESYDKVLMIDPNNDYVLNNYAYYLALRNENLDKAAKMAKKATELKPNNSSNQDTYGWVLYKMGYYDEAKYWINKALENNDDPSAVILEHYGDVLWQLGEKSQAVEYWNEAKKAGEGSEFLEKKITEGKLYE
ncbi:MAG: tetratricopeptide repeat protein [Bacteroidales bacterium]|nr:tetratricopeptide repeat protein [Bacteroidales bacterium]